MAVPDVRSSTAKALGEVAQTNPECITPEIVQRLISLLADDSGVRSNVTSALGSIAQTNSNLIMPETIYLVFALLKSNTSAASRNGATYALFEITLSNKDLDKALRDKLIGIQNSSQPHWRINASRTLEMLAIYDLTNRARSYPP